MVDLTNALRANAINCGFDPFVYIAVENVEIYKFICIHIDIYVYNIVQIIFEYFSYHYRLPASQEQSNKMQKT